MARTRSGTRYLLRAALALGLVAGSAATLRAQATGTITGHVTTATLRPLSGVAVRVQGGTVGAVTNERGDFTISRAPVGSQTVTASLLGYATTNETVQVTAGATVRVNFTLQESAVLLEGVTVSPIREGQAKALAQMKKADNIVSVVSADAVGNFPDQNVADALNRVSGIGLVRFRGEGVAVNIRGAPPEFSAISVNGVNLPSGSTERDANLNALTTDIIGALEVNKAITPDMDADAIGGRVNIVTRGALDAGKRRIRINPQLGYHSMGNVKDNYNGSFSYGDVFDVGSNRLGVLVSGSASEVFRQMDNLENTHVGNPQFGFRPNSLTVKAYDITRRRSSGTARLDYALGEKSHFFFSATQAKLDNVEFRNTASINFTTSFNATTGTFSNYKAGSDQYQGVSTAGVTRYNFHDRLTVTSTRSLSAGGRHTIGRATLDYTGNFSRQAAEEPPGRKYIAYRGATDAASLQHFKYDYSDPSFGRYTRLDKATGAELPQLMPDLSLQNFYEYNERYDLTEDRTRGFQTNLNLPYRLAGLAASFQMGAKITARDKDKVRSFVQALPSSTRLQEPNAPKISELLGGRTMNNYGIYNFGPEFLTPNVHANAGRIQNEAHVIASEAPNDYDIAETVSAAYGMTTVNVGKLRLVGGLRVERTDLTGTGKVSTDGWKTIQLKTNERTMTHVFPSVHAKYSLEDGTVLRAAFTTGINRPKFSNIRPSGNLIENETLSTFTGSNPDIRPTTARSFDLMAEHYFPLGVISGGFFLKQLSNPVFNTIRTGTASDFFVGQSLEGFRITRDDNGSDGVIRGFEINLDRSLDFLPGVLSGLGMMTNYTYTYSDATTPTGGKSTLANQPSRVVNLSGYFEKHGLSMRLSYNYQNDYVESIGEQDWQSLNVAPRTTVDWTSSLKLNRKASLFLDGSNLTNTIQRKYYGAWESGRMFEVEQFGRQLWTGVRLTF